MTPITKADHTLTEIREFISRSAFNKQTVNHILDKMDDLIEHYIYCKRKVENDQSHDLYKNFTDEFTIMYEEVMDKINVSEFNRNTLTYKW